MLELAKTSKPRILEGTLLSVIVPCFNEEAVIEQTDQRLRKVLNDGQFDYEIIFVDDGSTDGTRHILKSLTTSIPTQTKMLTLSRNFGHQAAVTAGLDVADGDMVVIIDADLQDPPEVILEMIDRWKNGYDVIYGQRTERASESRFKIATAKCFYRFLNYMSDTPIPVDTGDFRLMDKQVVSAIRQMPERDRFIRGMISWLGFNQTPVLYKRDARAAGKSKYPLRKMIAFALDGILSFSTKPLKLAIWLGIAISSFALLGIFYAVALRIFTSYWVSGWTFLAVAILFMGGVQLLFLGVVGEYIARIYLESKGRPLYIIEEALGFERHPTDQSS